MVLHGGRTLSLSLIHPGLLCDLMDSVVLQLCYDGWWETLADGSMEYVNGNNTAFLIRKDCTFDQFLARVYDVLQINRNEYNITMKTTLRSSNTMYRTCSLPMDIFNDEIVKVVLHMASDVVNYGCIPIFVTTSSRVDYQDLEPPVETVMVSPRSLRKAKPEPHD